MTHPKRGTPEHRTWCLDAIRRVGTRSRDAFMVATAAGRKAGERWPSSGDWIAAGGWGALVAEALSQTTVPVLPVRHRLKGVSSLVDPDGTVRAQWVKTAAEVETREAVLERLLVELPTKVPVRRGRVARPKGPASDELLAVYPLGDPHVGLLAWQPESGADFDLKICEQLLTDAMRNLVLRGPRTKRALILNLGDYLHFDGVSHHTTKGDHALDVDGRTAKVLAIGLRIFTTLIDAALEHHDHVDVDCRIGNHDGYTSIMLALALAAFYRNEPRVSVPATIAHRSYHVHGACLIGTTHGDRAKPEALAEIMAAERPEEWGRTRHRFWYVGHVHHQVVKEHRGCRVESFRTLAARDSWHAAQGYVSGRDMHRITLHTEHGEISREIVNVDALVRGARAA